MTVFNLAEKSSREIHIMAGLHLAVIYSLVQKYDKAIELIRVIDKKTSTLGRGNLLSEINLKKAFVYQNMKESQKVSESLKSPPLIAQVLSKLTMTCLELNDREKAQYYREKGAFII